MHNITMCLKWNIALILLLCAGGCDKNKSPTRVTMPVDSETGKPAVAALYTWPYKIIVAVWKDGQVVWGEDPASGGPPYYVANVDPSRVNELLDSLAKIGLFSSPANRYRLNFGPDASFTAITCLHGDLRQQLESWHEGAERHPNNVATDWGLESLNGRNRSEVLAACPRDYRKFRQIWSEARKLLIEVIPPSGKELKKFTFSMQRVPESN